MKLVLVAVVATLWVVITADRVRVWQDEPALWAEAVAHAPAKPRPWINLGRQYALRGADALAAEAYRTGLQLAEARPVTEARGARTAATTNLARLEVDLQAWFATP